MHARRSDNYINWSSRCKTQVPLIESNLDLQYGIAFVSNQSGDLCIEPTHMPHQFVLSQKLYHNITLLGRTWVV